MSSDHHVAIVGVAGRFPGACNAEQYWANLREGAECVAYPTDETLLAAGVPRQLLDQPGYVKAVASPPDVENFDAAFFGYTPRDAAHTDPQIRMFLEVAHSALENAGYNPYGIDGEVGVYGTAGVNRYVDMHLHHMGDRSATSSFMLSALSNTDYVASTVAYKLALRGPAITIATACSSSLVAVHMAAQALRGGECDVAVAGGVDVEFPVGHGYLWEEGGPVSRDGHVRPFDIKANGTLFGTGCGAVVLKRLDDALADRDSVLAVIRGSAVNNDGADKAGFSAPSPNGQAVIVAEALSMARISPAEVSYVEAHATGTPLGDPIEVAALDTAFRTVAGKTELVPGSCALSSVKGNVGHLGHAAGVASLIKVVFAMVDEQIPATAHFTEPNPKLRIDQTPFYVTDRLVPWRRSPGQPRYAGVSSFGVGGTNCHVVLGEGPGPATDPATERPRIVVWSAKSQEAAQAYQEKLATYLRWKGESIFPAAVTTLQEGRRPYLIRRAAVAASAAETATVLASSLAIDGASERRDVVFAFPGQGAQQVAMGAGLYGADDVFTRVFDQVAALFDGHGIPLAGRWREGAAHEIAETALAQPLLLAVEYALAQSLMVKGVQPSALIGHSVGELVAAAVAEVVTLPAAVALVAARARAMAAAPPGAMLAIAAPVAEVEAELPDGLTVAVVNGPRQTVLAGRPQDVAAAASAYGERGIACTRLATSGAFHSPLMDDAAAVFAEAFDDVRLAPPRIMLYSAAAGRMITDEEAVGPSFWAAQPAAPVRFDRALDTLLGDGPRLIIEVGPGRTLSTLAGGHPAVTSGTSAVVSLLPRKAGDPDADLRQFLATLARVWTEGHDLTWPEVRQQEPLRRVALPGYAYQRRRHWVDATDQLPAEPSMTNTSAGQAASTTPAGQGAAGKASAPAAETETPFSTLSWVEEPGHAEPFESAGGSCLALLPADPGAGLPSVLALQRAGFEPVIVRPGARYAEVGAEYRVRPNRRDDLARVLSAMAVRGGAPRLLVHALATGEPEPASAATVGARLDEVFFSALALAQVGTHGAGLPPGLLVLTARSLDITGAEQIDPVHAMLHGFVRSLVKEAPQLGCRLIDVGPGTGEDELASQIAKWQAHEVVALRGSRRWVRAAAPFMPRAGGQSPVRRGGVYLITGGLGGLGLTAARALAGTGLQPKLVLLGRTGLPEDDGGPASRLRAQVRELESRGAEVRTVACDVTDRRALCRALDTTTARYGPVNGVLHLAGIAGDSLAQLRVPDQARMVLAPKVSGTLELAEAFANRPALDFFVCFSSRAATDGLVGSADYAAANAFQDACMHLLRRSGTPSLSINWPSWARVGMAAEFGVRTWTAELSVQNCPLLDEHRVDGVPVLPGTGHIDLVLRAYQALTAQNGPVRLRDILFHRVLAAREPRQVEIRLYPDGRFESWSRPAADPAAVPVQHASGVISAARRTTKRVNLDALRARLPEQLGDEQEGDGPRLFTLGPRWQNNPYTWGRPGGDTSELLLHLELAGELAAEAAEHIAHPTLLDSATGSARRAGEAPHLPFLYRELFVYEPLPAHLFAHIRRRTATSGVIIADVDLIAPDGRLLGRAVEYTMRQVDDRQFLEEPPTAGQGTMPPPRAADEDIEPQDGARLFMTLLGSRHPGQVLVEPGARPVRRTATRPVPRGTATPAGRGTAVDAATPAGPGLSALTAAPASTPTRTAEPAGVPTGAQPGSVEARLQALWTEAFGEPDIALDADFFELGGNSLSAVELMTKVRGEFGVEVSIAALFDYPTIAHLAEVLREQGAR